MGPKSRVVFLGGFFFFWVVFGVVFVFRCFLGCFWWFLGLFLGGFLVFRCFWVVFGGLFWGLFLAGCFGVVFGGFGGGLSEFHPRKLFLVGLVVSKQLSHEKVQALLAGGSEDSGYFGATRLETCMA